MNRFVSCRPRQAEDYFLKNPTHNRPDSRETASFRDVFPHLHEKQLFLQEMRRQRLSIFFYLAFEINAILFLGNPEQKFQRR